MSFYERDVAVEDRNDPILSLSVHLVSSYVSNHKVEPRDLGDLVKEIYGKLQKLTQNSSSFYSKQNQKPAVPITKSVTPDYLVCLEDGKTLKILKRHLKTTYNMTPEEYRSKWDLPPDYPMVAPNYTKQRSRLAKNIGLGTGSARRRSTVS